MDRDADANANANGGSVADCDPDANGGSVANCDPDADAHTNIDSKALAGRADADSGTISLCELVVSCQMA